MSVEWIVSSSVMIFSVVLLRFVFRKKMQPCIRYALWLAVGLRLLVPISFSATAVSVLNLLPEQDLEGMGSGDGQWENRQAEDLPAGNQAAEKQRIGIELTENQRTGMEPGKNQKAGTGLENNHQAVTEPEKDHQVETEPKENQKPGTVPEKSQQVKTEAGKNQKAGTGLENNHQAGTEPAKEQQPEMLRPDIFLEGKIGETDLVSGFAVDVQNQPEPGLGGIREAAGNLPEDMEAGRKTDSAEVDASQNQGPESGTKGNQKKESLEGGKQAMGGITRPKAGRLDMGMMLRSIWLAGAVLWGIVLMAVNLNYSRRLARSRKKIAEVNLPKKSEIPVYTAEIVQTPCLFGLLQPAVYVTEAVAGEGKVFAYVLCHENVHYRHCDNWWVFVRNVCLCLHWYNPLVWLAAYLSRQDAELACDEKALEELGREKRVDYGRTLLDLSTVKFSGISGWRISTTMGGNKRQMKERLQMLVDAPGKAVWVRVLLAVVMAFVFAATFTGRNGQSFAASNQNGEDIQPGYGNPVDERPEEEKGLFTDREKTEAMPEEETGEALAREESDLVPVLEAGTEEEAMLGVEAEKFTASGETEEEMLDSGEEEKTASVPGMEAEKQPVLGEEMETASALGMEAEKQPVLGGETEKTSALGMKAVRAGKALVMAAVPEAADWQPEGKKREGTLAEEAGWAHTAAYDERNLVFDLNFDGWDDLCILGQYKGGVNVPYDCMLWNQKTQQYELSVRLYNVDVDEGNQWITSWREEGDGQYSITYYRYDEDNQLHMLRYVEENQSEDALFEQLDLTYVEESNPYGLLPILAIVDGTDLCSTFIAMAKQALEELYQWTGEKVSTACFEVSDLGGVYFGVTQEDIRHSRIFFSRYFGWDTDYRLDNNERVISSISVWSGRTAWYSPVLQHYFPDDIDDMTDEEVVRWYFERIPTTDGGKVKTVIKRYEDMWTVQAESGRWFEVCYDASLREVWDVTGPYQDFPEH